MKANTQLLIWIIILFYWGVSNAQNQTMTLGNCGLEKLLQKAPNSIDAQKRQELYLKMAGALEELGQYRKNMLNEKGLIDLFPTAYYHTTMSEMEKIRAGEYQHPIEKLNQMLAFYDAYKYNRINWEKGSHNLMDQHWLKHFQNIQNIETRSIGIGQDYKVSPRWVFDLQTVLNTGVDAHVNNDLERAIRYAYKNRFNQRITENELVRDFGLTDNIFGGTVEKLNKDIAQTFSIGMVDKPLKELGMLGYNAFMDDQKNVIKGRHEAWDRAFRGESKKYDIPQPTTDHQDLFRKGQGKNCDCQGSHQMQSYTLHKGFEKFGMDTGIMLQRGDQIVIRATGTIVYGPLAGDGDPDGIDYTQLFNYVPHYPHGSLMYRIGSERYWNFAGANARDVAKYNGNLYLNINDKYPSNNSGTYVVTIRTCRFNR